MKGLAEDTANTIYDMHLYIYIYTRTYIYIYISIHMLILVNMSTSTFNKEGPGIGDSWVSFEKVTRHGGSCGLMPVC